MAIREAFLEWRWQGEQQLQLTCETSLTESQVNVLRQILREKWLGGQEISLVAPPEHIQGIREALDLDRLGLKHYSVA